jgi:hypothetical protein
LAGQSDYIHSGSVKEANQNQEKVIKEVRNYCRPLIFFHTIQDTNKDSTAHNLTAFKINAVLTACLRVGQTGFWFPTSKAKFTAVPIKKAQPCNMEQNVH